MGIYAQRRGRMVGQIVSDALVLVWAVVWGFVGSAVHQTVGQLAAPVRSTMQTASNLSRQLEDAANEAAKVPGVGEQLRKPFDAASGSLGELILTASQQVTAIERTATLAGWLTFLIPVSVVVAFWLPRRIAFVRRARATQRLIDSAADLDLFALRAMATQPMHVLAAISDDPVRAWREGDRDVINRLAEVELNDSGLVLADTSAQAVDAD